MAAAAAPDDGQAADPPRWVLLVDDHPMVRRALATLLRQLHRQVQVLEASTVAGARQCLAAQPGIHLIVYDWKLPQGGGLDGLRELRERQPQAQVLVLTGHDDQAYSIAAASVGAEFLSKAEEPEQVRRTLERLLLQPRADGVHADPAPARSPTTRQREVLRLLARGWPNKRIAQHLGVSDKTISTHVTDILHLLDAANRTEAVMIASRRRWIDPPDRDGPPA